MTYMFLNDHVRRAVARWMPACLLVCIFATGARADLKSDAARENKPCMVLCVGGDWCVSGEKVRGVYDSAAFRKALGGRWLFGVSDVREAPHPAAVSNENARVKSLDTATSRFPALILFNSRGEGVGRIENIPHDVTAVELAKQVAERDAVRMKAEAEFAAGRRGEGFDLLRAQTPNLFRRERKGTWNANAYADEWKAMRAADPDDREGWVLHFTMGDGIGDVAKATSLAEKPEEGEAFIAELRKRPTKHLTTEQRQSIDMAEFAFLRKRPEKKARARELLRAVYRADPGTLWGWAAQGYLNDAEFGESVPPASTNRAAAVKYGRGIVDMPIRPHVAAAKPAPPGAAAKLYARERRKLAPAFTKRGVFTPDERRALVRTWAIHEIGTNTLQSVLALEGGRAFANKFLQDEEWLEEFFASGPVEAPAAAFTNLFELVWNDSRGEILAGGLARRVATAIALNTSAKSEAGHFVRAHAAYMFLARAGRLHKSAYGQSVREWRFSVGRILDAANLLYLNQHFNYRTDSYGGALNAVPYRLHNCFGESIHGPRYYRPWRDCDWPSWSLRPRVGGVCGALSTFGALSANAHGLMATTGGQPGHCAYNRRRANGSWNIHNYVGRYTTAHYCFWGHAFTYLDAIERSYADRESQLQVDRLTWMARLAEDGGASSSAVEAWHRLAVKAQPKHLGAWREYSAWLARSNAGVGATSAFMRAFARAMPDGRQATWDVVNDNLARIAKDRNAGPKRAVDELVRLYAMLPQPTNTPTREEMDVQGLLRRQAKIIGNDDELARRMFKAALTAQIGRPVFAEVLGWGAEMYLKNAAQAGEFVKLVESVCGRGKSGGTVIDCRGMMAAAVKTKDFAVFRTVAGLFERLNPMDPHAPRYPESDFGGRLLSAGGMLTTSTTSNWDKPELYARVIDSSRKPNPSHPNDLTTFHTAKETAPWAMVELPGDAQVTGVFLLNKSGQNAHRQVPFDVMTSEDGKTWTNVFHTDKLEQEYRIPITPSRRARYVKVARTPDAKEEFFHFGKILVYGRKLY